MGDEKGADCGDLGLKHVRAIPRPSHLYVRFDVAIARQPCQVLDIYLQRINQALEAWERDGWLQQRYGEIVLLCLDALPAEAGG